MSGEGHLVEGVAVGAVALLEMGVPEWEQLGGQLVGDRAIIRGRAKPGRLSFQMGSGARPDCFRLPRFSRG